MWWRFQFPKRTVSEQRSLYSSSKSRNHSTLKRRLVCETLEERTLLSIDLISSASSSMGSVIGNSTSQFPSISADGRYVAFISVADNLVAGDANGTADAFVKDTLTGETTLVSTRSDGTQGNGSCKRVSISADGTYVAFGSLSSNLVAGDTNGTYDVFIKNRTTGDIVLASTSTAGVQGNGSSDYAVLSPDGRYLAFCSAASNLVDGDTNGTWDSFVKDLQTGTTTLVSTSTAGEIGNGYSWCPTISDDGRYVAFASLADNLVPDDSNDTWDVFVKDLQTGQVTLASANIAGVQGNDDSECAGISGDGHHVVFLSLADNFVPGDANGTYDVFSKDLQTGEITLASADAAGLQGDAMSGGYVTNHDGRFVTFVSLASNLIDGDTNGKSDVFVKDIQTGAIRRLSVSDSGNQGNSECGDPYDPDPVVWSPQISSDGRYVAFITLSSNLVDGDSNGTWDVLRAFNPLSEEMADTTPPTITLADEWTTPYAMPTIALTVTDDDSGVPDGTIVYVDVDWNTDGDVGDQGEMGYATATLVGGAARITLPDALANGSYSICVRVSDAAGNPALANATVTVDVPSIDAVSSADYLAGSVIGDAESGSMAITPDGRYVGFVSSADNLVEGDTNGVADVFLKDMLTGEVQRVSTSTAGVQANGTCRRVSVSADGRYVVFASLADNLVEGDTNGAYDLFLKDLQTGALQLVSTSSTGVQGNSNTDYAYMTPDGRYIAFCSSASNLVEGDTNGTWDTFVKDLQTGTTTLASVTSGGTIGNDISWCPSISDDGRFVEFSSLATNLAASDTNGAYDVFVKDLQTGTLTLVSANTSGVQGNGDSRGGGITGNGRYALVISLADNLADSDTNGVWDTFVKDLETGTMTRVSTDSSGGQGDDASGGYAASTDGRYVVFCSLAGNLVAGDTNDVVDVFVKDLQTGAVARVSVDNAGVQGNGDCANQDLSTDAYRWLPRIAGGGDYVVFASLANNLVDGDTNGTWDIFRVANPLASPADHLFVTTADDVVDANDGLTSLREAIVYANQHAGDDTITFDSALVGQTIDVSLGELQITDTSGTTTITGLGHDVLAVSGGDSSRVLSIRSGATVAISGLTISQGFSTEDGGGIANGGTLTVSDCCFFSNTSTGNGGGGIANSGTLTVSGSEFADNQGYYGGAIGNDYGRTATITDCTFSLNNGAAGGAVCSGGELTIDACSFSRNTAAYGGAVCCVGGTMELTDSDFSDNVASVHGGGVQTAGSVTITDCTFTGNTADSDGGGLQIGSGEATITNCTFSENLADGEGGGICNTSGTVTIDDSTVSDNRANWLAGGIQNRATMTVTNSTIQANSSRSAGAFNNEATLILNEGMLTFSEGMLTLVDSIIADNVADSDVGGIFNMGGTVIVLRCTITGNVAEGDNGGGLFNAGTLSITDSTVSDNWAADSGGGICNWDNGTVTVTGSTLSGNHAEVRGGAIFNRAGSSSWCGTITIINSTLDGNSAVGPGGGIYTGPYGGTFTIDNSTFADNHSDADGGAIYSIGWFLGSSSTTIANSTFCGNSAAGSGGAIYNGSLGCTLAISNCTLTANNAATGGGIFSLSAHTTALTSTILAGNGGNTVSPDLDGAADLSNSLIGDATGSTLLEAPFGAPDVDGNLIGGLEHGIIDPRLAPLDDNGGPTPTMALLPGSPAINMGSNPTGLTYDQRGDGFPRTVGFATDIGAYEFFSDDITPPLVTTTGPAHTSNPTPAITVTASDEGSGVADGTLVVLDVDLNGDGDFADPGETALATEPLAAGVATFTSPAALPDGVYHVRARVRDMAGNQGFSNVLTTVINLSEVPAVDFRDYTIAPYDLSQDTPGGYAVGSGGASLLITGNHWKAIDFPYTVTPNTVLEFNFQSNVQGEIQGIGVDNDNIASPETCFQLFGTQTWGLQAYRNYASTAGDAVHYTIPVGEFFTGDISRLVFFTDDDAADAGQSLFSNVHVYEKVLSVDVQGTATTFAVTSYGAEDLVSEDLTFSDLLPGLQGFQTVQFSGNSWKKIDLGYTVTANTILEFDFQSSAQGEIQGIGFDSDQVLSDQTFFQLYGSQSWGRQAFRNYASSAGETVHYVIPVGRYFSGDLRYLVLACDDDADASGAVTFSNLRIYEPQLNVEVQGFTDAYLVTSYDAEDLTPQLMSLEAATPESDGFETLQFAGNAWKKIELGYTITTDTILEFDFQSSAQGEIQGIGFDNDQVLSDQTFFQLYGTQNWGRQAYHNYASSAGETVHYVIPVGKYFTGDLSYLVLATDDDADASGSVVFSNLRVYEPKLEVDIQGTAESLEVTRFSDQELVTLAMSLQTSSSATDGFQTFQFIGNGWQQAALDYTITADTVLEFDFQSSTQGEIHGIGFDNDAVLSPEWFFQLFGTQTWGIQAYRNYGPSEGSVQRYTIPIGDYFQGITATRLVFATDDDAQAAAESIFSNIYLYESGSQPTATLLSNDWLDPSILDQIVGQDGSASEESLALQSSFGRWQVEPVQPALDAPRYRIQNEQSGQTPGPNAEQAARDRALLELFQLRSQSGQEDDDAVEPSDQSDGVLPELLPTA